MDIILALKFASQQYINGVFDGEAYYGRLQELLEEAVAEADAEANMVKIAKFVFSHD